MAEDDAYKLRMRGDRTLSLSIEPGERPVRLYCLSLRNGSMSRAAFVGDEREMLEFLMAVGRIATRVYESGLPRAAA